jgi:hypothetical protein
VILGKTVGTTVRLDGPVTVGNSIGEVVGSTADPMVGDTVGVVGLKLSVTIGIKVGGSIGEAVGSKVDSVMVGKTVCPPGTLDGIEVSITVGIIVESVGEVVGDTVDILVVGIAVSMIELPGPVGRAVGRPIRALVGSTIGTATDGIPLATNGLELILMVGIVVGRSVRKCVGDSKVSTGQILGRSIDTDGLEVGTSVVDTWCTELGL